MRIIHESFFSLINKHLKDYPSPKNLGYFWNFGSLLGVALTIQIVSGIFLAMYYTPYINLKTFLDKICASSRCETDKLVFLVNPSILAPALEFGEALVNCPGGSCISLALAGVTISNYLFKNESTLASFLFKRNWINYRLFRHIK